MANFRVTRLNVSEKKGTATLTIDLNTKATAALTLNYLVAPQTARPGGVDFTLATGSVDFAINERTKTITISLFNDSLDENHETLQVWLTDTSGPVAIGKNRAATVTIVDDDTTPKVSFRTKTSSADESTSPSLEVFLNVVSGRAVSVNYTLAKTSKAKVGSDFNLTNGTLTFQPGEISKFIPLPVLDDTLDELDETIIISLTRPVNAFVSGFRTHTHTITDNDTPPAVYFGMAAAPVSEDAGTVYLNVVLSNASGLPVKVKYALDVSGLALNGKDFTFKAGTLTFNPGETVKKIAVKIINDKQQESDETVKVRLSAPTLAILDTPDLFTLTITDNDP
jgi:hypothetical protein